MHHCQAHNCFEVSKFGPVCEEAARYTIPSQRSRDPRAVEPVCWVHRTAYMHGRNLTFASSAPVVELEVAESPKLAANG